LNPGKDEGDPRNNFALEGQSFTIEYSGNDHVLEHHFRNGLCQYSSTKNRGTYQSVPYKTYQGEHLLLWLEKRESPLTRAIVLFGKSLRTAICCSLTSGSNGKISISVRRGAVNEPYTYETALAFPPYLDTKGLISQGDAFAECWTYELQHSQMQIKLEKDRSAALFEYNERRHNQTLLYSIGSSLGECAEFARQFHSN
jgi:hypothetical protein